MNENISNLLRKPGVVPGLVGAAAFATGATLGYLLGKRNTVTIVPAEPENQQLSFAFHDEADRALTIDGPLTVRMEASMLDPLFTINPASVILPATDAIVEFEQNLMAGEGFVTPEPEPTVVNIFAIDDPDWDYEAELSTRSGEAPYILHKDEFLNDEMGYRQTTVSYYAGDDIMSDEQDTPVYDYNKLMGPLKWGHGSGDPGVVYIRNEKSRQEWEVLLHTGRYEVEVLGNEYAQELAEDELRHSNNRRFRDV